MRPLSGDQSWRSRLGGLRPLLEDPSNAEVFVAPSGRIVVRDTARRLRASVQAPAMKAAEIASLARALARALGQPLTQEHPNARGALTAAFEVSIAAAPLIQKGFTISFTRRAQRWSSISDLRDDGTLEARIALVLERAAAIASSIVVVGRRPNERRRVLGALAAARAGDKRLAVAGACSVPEQDAASRDLIVLSKTASLDACDALGVDAVVVEDPTPAQWSQLLTGSTPFLACTPGLDLEGTIERLAGALSFARPGLSRGGSDALLAAAIDLVVEVGESGDHAVIASLAELERTPEGLAPHRVAQLKSDGGVELAIRGSKLERRFEHRGGDRPDASPIPKARSASLRAASAVLGRGGISVIGGEPENEAPAAGPVGRLTREQLAELTPDQLVSQSFIVDVRDVAPVRGVRLVDESGPISVPPPANPSKPPQERDTTSRAALRELLGRNGTELADPAEHSGGVEGADLTIDLDDSSKVPAVSAAIERLARARKSFERDFKPSIPPANTPIAPLPVIEDELPLFKSGDIDRTLNAGQNEMLPAAAGNNTLGLNEISFRSGSMTAAGLLAEDGELEPAGPDAILIADEADSTFDPEGTMPKSPAQDPSEEAGGVLPEAARASFSPGSARRKLR